MRSRTERQPSGRRVTPQPRDILIFSELQEHGSLTLPYLHDLIKLKEPGAEYTSVKRRLEDLFHEPNTPDRDLLKARDPLEGAYLDRLRQLNPKYTRHLFSVYSLNDYSRAVLAREGKLHQYARPPRGPHFHNFMASCVSASFKLGMKDAFMTAEQLLALKPDAPRRVDYPLAMPVSISHPKHDPSDRPVEPDGLYGVRYENKTFRAFFPEIDRGTEPPSLKDLTENSYLRKILCYRTITEEQTPIKHFGISSYMMLFITNKESKLKTFINKIYEVYPQGVQNIAATAVPEFDVPSTEHVTPPPIPDLFTRPYKRAGYVDFNLNNPDRQDQKFSYPQLLHDLYTFTSAML